jgi:hypothetical protein
MSHAIPGRRGVARPVALLSFLAASLCASLDAAAAVFTATPPSLPTLSAPQGGTSVSANVTVTNASGRTDTARVSLNSGQFQVTPTSCKLRRGASCTLSVSFKPTQSSGTVKAQLAVQGGSGATPVVALTGNVLTAAFSVSPASLSFATAVGSTAEMKTLTVTNTGAAAGKPGVTATGAGASQFPTVNGCTAPINPNATCAVRIGFAPTSSGTKTANLAVSGVTSQQTVALNGTIVTSKPQGQWSSAIYDWPDVAIHLHLLRDGRVLSFSDDGAANGRFADRAKAFVVPIPPNGVPGVATPIDNTTTNVFCSGHTFLPDGRLLVAGGHEGRDGNGSVDTNIFEYSPSYDWTRHAPMYQGRWYPVATALANGDVLVVGGNALANGQIVRNLVPEVWNHATGSWTRLSGASLNVILYAPMHLAPDGRVFMSGSPNANVRQTLFLDTSGNGEWALTPRPERKYTGMRDYGPSVLLEDSKVLVMGGGTTPPTATSEIIDLKGNPPTWNWTANSMAFARRHLNATLLPDGTVLVTGGTSSPGFNDGTNAVYAAELWNPKTGLWTTMASAKVKRLYHSTALLLPDGRVLSAGGGRPPPTNGSGTDNYNAEIYSPPYLFTGVRPTITSAPASIAYGSQFQVQVATNATDITKVSLVALGSVTHTLNMSQRIKFLTFTPSGTTLTVRTPTERTLVPPGYYMLFVINSNGAPSVAKMVQVVEPAQ